MPLPPEANRLVQQVYRDLDPFKPLKPGSPFYEPIYAGETLPDIEDPLAQMRWHMETQEVESVQFFSGYRGSGKTTELLRLQQELERNGCVVFYANALEYINPSEPIDIVDLLMVIAGAFSDGIEAMGISLGKESYWGRFWNFLKSEVELKEATFKSEMESPLKAFFGGGKTAADIKLGLRSTPTFRQALQSFLSARLSELEAQTHQFLEVGVKAIRRERGEKVRIVFILDQLEQIRGSLFNQEAVIQSVERLFAQHLEKLRLPYLHTVYTVPPWIRFYHPGLPNLRLLPSLRLWYNDPQRRHCDPAWKVMGHLVERRFGSAENLTAVFGPGREDGSHPRLDRLIGLCGGHIRDLFRLIQEALIRVAQSPQLPVTDLILERAITEVREQYRPIAVEDALWLDRVATERSDVLPDTGPESADRLARFLDSHVILYFRNGKGWYDVHPLVRDEVHQIAQAERGRRTAS